MAFRTASSNSAGSASANSSKCFLHLFAGPTVVLHAQAYKQPRPPVRHIHDFLDSAQGRRLESRREPLGTASVAALIKGRDVVSRAGIGQIKCPAHKGPVEEARPVS